MLHHDAGVVADRMAGILQPPGELHFLVGQQDVPQAAGGRRKTAGRQQGRDMHDQVRGVGLDAGRQGRRAVFPPALLLQDRQHAAQPRRPPVRQRHLPSRQDSPAQQGWRARLRDKRGKDALHPVGGGNGIVVDIGDIGRCRGRSPGVAGDAEARLLHPDQAGSGMLPNQTTQMGRRIAGGRAVHQQNREPVPLRGLAPQPIQAELHIAWPVAGADADGELHATGGWT